MAFKPVAQHPRRAAIEDEDLCLVLPASPLHADNAQISRPHAPLSLPACEEATQLLG
jgi:hypothetical protein